MNKETKLITESLGFVSTHNLRMKQEEIILPDSDDAAKIMTVTGWVSRDGFYCGKDEQLARYRGSTHRKCEDCGTPTKKTGYIVCDSCRERREFTRWKELEFEVYEGQPVYSHLTDAYYFDSDDLTDAYLELVEENGIESPDEMMLVNLIPNHFSQIDFDHWFDDLPEDGEIPSELAKKVEELNKFIETLPPSCYFPGKKRITDFNPEKP